MLIGESTLSAGGRTAKYRSAAMIERREQTSAPARRTSSVTAMSFRIDAHRVKKIPTMHTAKNTAVLRSFALSGRPNRWDAKLCVRSSSAFAVLWSSYAHPACDPARHHPGHHRIPPHQQHRASLAGAVASGMAGPRPGVRHRHARRDAGGRDSVLLPRPEWWRRPAATGAWGSV